MFKQQTISNDLSAQSIETHTTITPQKIINQSTKIVANYSDVLIQRSGQQDYNKGGQFDQYMLGVVIAFSCAFTAGLSLVLASKSKECSNSLLMIVVGFGTLLVATIGPLLNLENRFFDPLSEWETTGSGSSLTHDMMLTIGVGVISILGVLLLVFASQIAPPTLVSMVRSTEILLALVAEKVMLVHIVEDDGEVQKRLISWLIVGSLVVVISVAAMAASDWIQEFIDSSKRCYTNSQQNETTEEINASERLVSVIIPNIDDTQITS